jgi:putative acetyltransferase
VEFTIRVYEQRDAADLADVFFRSVRQVAISDYTPAQVSAWAPERRTPEQSHQWAGDGRLVLLATGENDRAVAFIDLEPDGHIDHFSVRPRQQGRGSLRSSTRPRKRQHVSKGSAVCIRRQAS